MPAEIWRPVPGYEDYYEVSDLGRVRSWRMPPRSRVKIAQAPRVLKRNPGRYFTVVLCGDEGRRTWAVHQLVALAFFGPRPVGQEVRHLNGDATDCRVVNLVYGTHQENVRDAFQHGVMWQSRLTECAHGHAFDEANTYLFTTKQGGVGRRCRACVRNYNQRRREAA
jgi:hypothetical protein